MGSVPSGDSLRLQMHSACSLDSRKAHAATRAPTPDLPPALSSSCLLWSPLLLFPSLGKEKWDRPSRQSGSDQGDHGSEAGAPCWQEPFPWTSDRLSAFHQSRAGARTALSASILVSGERTRCSPAGLARPRLMHRPIQALPEQNISSGRDKKVWLACGAMFGDALPVSGLYIRGEGLLTFSSRTALESHRTYLALCMRICMLIRSVVSDSSVTPQTVARQAPLSMGFFRQKYWSRLPCPPPGHRPQPRIKSMFPALAGEFFTTALSGKPYSGMIKQIKL